jgi:hypothetical protein
MRALLPNRSGDQLDPSEKLRQALVLLRGFEGANFSLVGTESESELDSPLNIRKFFVGFREKYYLVAGENELGLIYGIKPGVNILELQQAGKIISNLFHEKRIIKKDLPLYQEVALYNGLFLGVLSHKGELYQQLNHIDYFSQNSCLKIAGESGRTEIAVMAKCILAGHYAYGRGVKDTDGKPKNIAALRLYLEANVLVAELDEEDLVRRYVEDEFRAGERYIIHDKVSINSGATEIINDYLCEISSKGRSGKHDYSRVRSFLENLLETQERIASVATPLPVAQEVTGSRVSTLLLNQR